MVFSSSNNTCRFSRTTTRRYNRKNVIRNKIWLIALSLAVMGVLIYVGDKWASNHYKKETKFENITLKQAIIIGISQAFLQ